MTIKQKEGFYYTSDLALATVISLSYPIRDLDMSNPRKTIFIFQRDAGLDALIKSYWSGDLEVEPQALFNQLRVIKGRLYGQG